MACKLILFLALGVVGFLLLLAAESRAESAHFTCAWIKQVAQPFTLTVQDATTYIEGSLGIFGQVTPTIEQDGLYAIRLDLAGGFVAFRWPKAGGPSSIGFFNSEGQLQGGHPAAANCKRN